MTTPEQKPTATAVVKFMQNGDVVVLLSSCNGVTARKLDTAMTALYKKLGELRAVERRKDSAKRTASIETQDEVS